MDRPAPIVRVAKGIVRVLGMNPGPFTLDGTNTYLVGNGERRLLVDTGDGEQPAYFDMLKECLGGSRIDRILLTHWHADHIGGVRRLLDMPDIVAPDCTVHKCPDEAVDSSEAVAAMLALAKSRNKLRSIADAEVFDAGDGLQLRALFTPGHADDHMAFTVRPPAGELMLLTGDLVLGRGTTVVQDLGPYMDSLHRVLAVRPSALLPGHGPIISGGDAAHPDAVRLIEGYIAHRNMRERQIAAVICGPPPDAPPSPRNGGWRVEEVASVVYPDITDPPVVRAAQNNTRLHLDKLVRDGSAKVSHAAVGDERVDLYAPIGSAF
ncbi:Beta-lactamase-like protein 2 [Coemansia biformis]|uniref:Beta-lactamase-like protein 2 n=1 Tax=Coemansia biformis TaxID=1286918 RepID=A0A9W7YB26_9FUNG|nr:Beta-lactamase-like protein 2 [Coemansia biformis]